MLTQPVSSSPGLTTRSFFSVVALFIRPKRRRARSSRGAKAVRLFHVPLSGGNKEDLEDVHDRDSRRPELLL
jgi:hypothetical protein